MLHSLDSSPDGDESRGPPECIQLSKTEILRDRSLGYARDFGSRLGRRDNASTSLRISPAGSRSAKPLRQAQGHTRKTAQRTTPGSRRETTCVSSNSIHTLLASIISFVRIIFAVFSDGYRESGDPVIR